MGKQVRVVVTTTDAYGGSTQLESAGTDVANVNDDPTGSVTIAGTATQGQTLTASNTLADEDGLGAISYQWQADGTDIEGETANTLTLTQAQVGKVITVVASYTDGFDTDESVISAATVAVENVDDAASGDLAVTGVAQEGGALVASLTNVADPDGATTTAYRWQQNTGTVEEPVWEDIDGATDATLTIPGDQSYVNKVVRVVATTTDALGGKTSFEGEVQTIQNVDDAASGVVTISGLVQELSLIHI